MSRTSILFRLAPGYGLGDVCQQTAVVRHLRHYRPDWDIDFCGDPGKSDCMLGLCRAVYAHGQEPHDLMYDRVADVDLYDTLAGWRDRPNTRVSAVLHEKFGLDWVRELGRYRIDLDTEECHVGIRILNVMNGSAGDQLDATKKRFVAFHFEGNSASERKNLTTQQSRAIVKMIDQNGCRSLLGFSGSAKVNASLIRGCRAFIGIDSGPSKVAAATDTPALVCWTGNHPALYFDPAPNVTHLVPARHEDNDMLARSGPQARENALAFFRENYNFRFYQSPEDLPAQVGRWLEEVL